MGAEPLGYLTVAGPPPDVPTLGCGVCRPACGRPAAVRLPPAGRRHHLDPRPPDALAYHPGPGPRGQALLRSGARRRRRRLGLGHARRRGARPARTAGGPAVTERGAGAGRPLPHAAPATGAGEAAARHRHRRDRCLRRPGRRSRPHLRASGVGGAIESFACRSRRSPAASPGAREAAFPAATTTSCCSRLRRASGPRSRGWRRSPKPWPPANRHDRRGEAVQVVDADGRPLALDRLGWRHFCTWCRCS